MTVDLSAAFGESANARLRGLLPRHRTDDAASNPAAEPSAAPAPAEHAAPSSGTTPNDDDRDDEPVDDQDGEVAVDQDDEPADDHRPADDPRTAARRATASPAPRRRPEPQTGGRRWGLTRVASPEHVDLLVLAALAPGPDSAAGIIASLREGSDGLLDAPERTVHATLHRLARNRLLHRVGTGPRGGPRYALTVAGARAVEARVRRWYAFAQAVDGVLAHNDLD